jgi:ParB/RepB/Spo0J family partition protein
MSRLDVSLWFKRLIQGRRKKKQTENSIPSNYRDLPVARIRGNKWNPRSSGFDGPKFDELVASIRQRGVIQPIVVRSIQESDYDFEIIAGERRHRAMSLVASEDPTKGTIPAIIRECNDEDALEICFIENLQRQDLSEPEEAKAFAEYVDRKGLDGVIILAEKLGISPRYVRKRVEIMRLPRPLIWAWQKEIIQYGHLEQFLRIDGKKERLMMLEQIIGAWTGGEGIPTVRDFKQSIDEASADLGRAFFDKKACSTCARNSETQRNLFGIGDDQARCLDSRCYLTKQKEWLGENWQSHLKEIDPELNTNGMRFADEVSLHGLRTLLLQACA